MPIYLVFVFLLMSGIAFAGAWFFTESVFRESPQRSLLMFRNGLTLFALIFPVAIYGVYFASLPAGETWITAFYPALWIFMVLIAVVLGMTVALARRDG